MKFLKKYFLPILFLIVLAGLSYMERNSLCDSYNSRVNLHLASYINKEDAQGRKNAVFFAEQSKNQFAKKLDNLILIIFCGFGTVIISQLRINKNKKLKDFRRND